MPEPLRPTARRVATIESIAAYGTKTSPGPFDRYSVRVLPHGMFMRLVGDSGFHVGRSSCFRLRARCSEPSKIGISTADSGAVEDNSHGRDCR
jgi:hypothetical protein